MAETFTDQLLSLEFDYEEAKQRRAVARDALRHQDDDVAGLLDPIRRFGHAVEHREPSAGPAENRAERERELTAEFIKAVQDGGLVIRADKLRGIVPVDPTRITRYHEADAEATEIGKRIEAFKADHAADLERERQEAEADAYRQALDASNLDAARRIFNGEDTNRSGVFTTDDLARPAVHKRSPVLGR